MAANYVESYLHYNILHHPSFIDDPKLALTESFLATQADFRKRMQRLYSSTNAGSTAVVLVIKGKKLFSAWVGDSSAVLYRKSGENIDLINPHKPTQEVSAIDNQISHPLPISPPLSSLKSVA